MDIGKLIDIDPRHAWQNEARHFTPWLAGHLDELGEVLGIPLEMTGTEVPIEGFAADILARNLHDGSLVLIENQLEKTDHSHLGQILTYLAGLEAKTIVWIATDFREPHLSAVKWLNDHTAEDFNFFAIRLRVVRILAKEIGKELGCSKNAIIGRAKRTSVTLLDRSAAGRRSAPVAAARRSARIQATPFYPCGHPRTPANTTINDRDRNKKLCRTCGNVRRLATYHRKKMLKGKVTQPVTLNVAGLSSPLAGVNDRACDLCLPNLGASFAL